MQFYVGQKIRLLHDSGEGVVTRIIDRKTVEVDLGDDFPMDMNVEEIIPVHEGETFFSKTEKETLEDESDSPTVLGTSLFDLSLVIIPADENAYEFRLINPESHDVLYTFFIKIRHKYKGLTCGKVDSGKTQLLGRISATELAHTRELYFQTIYYKEGTGMPQAPVISAISWGQHRLEKPKVRINAIKKDGWMLSLKEVEEEKIEEAVSRKEEGFVSMQNWADQVAKVEIIDLHIEKLVTNAFQLSGSAKLAVQRERIEKALSQALLHHHHRIVFIHGIGEGVLRNELIKILKSTGHVKSFRNADPVKYGNGATEVFLEI